MLNRRSIEAVAAAAVGPHEVRPLYGSYCFSRIPWTIEAALTGEPNPRTLPADTLGALADRPDTVVLLFVDAFGWRFFEEFAESTPALARFLRDGTVSKLTSVFPSTTSAHVACLHSGLTPAESGIYEWYQYEPAVGEMIAPLLSSRAGDKGRNGLDLPPGTLFDGETLHERLAARGVRSISVTPAEFTPSPFNDAFTRGTVEVPWKGLARGLNALARAVAIARRPGAALDSLLLRWRRSDRAPVGARFAGAAPRPSGDSSPSSSGGSSGCSNATGATLRTEAIRTRRASPAQARCREDNRSSGSAVGLGIGGRPAEPASSSPPTTG